MIRCLPVSGNIKVFSIKNLHIPDSPDVQVFYTKNDNYSCLSYIFEKQRNIYAFFLPKQDVSYL